MDLYEALDKAGLSEEECKKGKKLQQIRIILIDKYLNLMSREETCKHLFDLGLDYISLNTYQRRLKEGVKRTGKYLD